MCDLERDQQACRGEDEQSQGETVGRRTPIEFDALLIRSIDVQSLNAMNDPKASAKGL